MELENYLFIVDPSSAVASSTGLRQETFRLLAIGLVLEDLVPEAGTATPWGREPSMGQSQPRS
jgi:hypothetical protein